MVNGQRRQDGSRYDRWRGQGVDRGIGKTQYLFFSFFLKNNIFSGVIFMYVDSLSLRQLNNNGNDRHRTWIPLRNPKIVYERLTLRSQLSWLN
jgi:hypothetical protein